MPCLNTEGYGGEEPPENRKCTNRFLYGWVGSDDGWRRTKVGMVIADVGLGQSASRGKDKQSWRMCASARHRCLKWNALSCRKTDCAWNDHRQCHRMNIGWTPISVDAMCRHRLFASRVSGWGLKQCPNLLSALRSGIAKGAINAAWDAIGEVIFFCSFLSCKRKGTKECTTPKAP